MPTRVSSASELQAALRSAEGGDTILLESGDYGWVTLDNLKFDAPVTITSADGDGGARFRHITLKDSSHITLDNLTVEYGPVSLNNELAIDIRGSHHIKITNSEIIGNTKTTDWSDVGRGIQVWHQSGNIEISNNHLHHFDRAALFFGDDITITNNLIDDIRVDGLFFGMAQRILVENNFLTNFYRQGTDHADYIQFDPGTTGAARDVVIRGNVMLKGEGNGDVQGIFGANHHMNVHNSVFENFLVENNIYLDHGLNALYFYSGKNMVVRNNTVLTDPEDGRVVWIRLTGPQENSVIEDNVATQVNAEGGATAAGNIVVQYRDPSGPNYYGDLFVNPFANPATLADLAPKDDSPIGYGSGKGAEARFQELLEGGAADTARSDANDTPADDDTGDASPAAEDAREAASVEDEDEDAGEASLVEADYEMAPVEVEDDGDPTPATTSGTFTGPGSEVILPHQEAFALTDGILELTFTPESVSARQAVFSKDANGFGDGGHLTVAIDNGDLIARLQSMDQSFVVRADNALSAGEAHHAAIGFGENGLKLYLNGELVDSNDYTGGLAGNAEPIVLGASQATSSKETADKLSDFFTGTIEAFALYAEPAAGEEFLLLS